MFNVGGPEILVIIVVALIVLGPDQLPKAMRTFGNVMAEIRKVSNGFQTEMRNAMDSLAEDDAPARAASPRSLAATPEEADVTEIVARNTGGTADGPIDAAGAEVAPAPEPEPDVTADRPAIDPADRAAG